MSNQLPSVPATPPAPTPLRTYNPFAIKAATPDLLINAETLGAVEIEAQLAFEEISGQELINMSRHDLINGQNIRHSPIRNISGVSSRYNSRNLIPVQSSSSSIFDSFSIRLDDFLPNDGEGSQGQYVSNFGTGPNGESVYLDDKTGRLTINLVGVPKDHQIEVQVIKNFGLISDTIYGEDL